MEKKSLGNKRIKMIYIILLLLIPLTLPDYFQRIKVIESMSYVIIASLFISTFFITIIKKQFNILVLTTFAFFIWRSFSSYYYSNEVLDLVNTFRILTLILLINLTIKKFPKSTLNALSYLFSIYIMLNFISLFLYPNGMYEVERTSIGTSSGWILGVGNQFAFALIPGVIFIMLNSWYEKNKITLFVWLNIIVVFISFQIVESATAIVSLIFIVIMIILTLFNKGIKFISFYKLLSFYVILWYLIIRIDKIPIFHFFIVDILNKDITLSFRTIIWDKVFDVIPHSIWTGYGINTYVLAGKVTSFAAHNMILQIFLDSGIIGFLLFCICIVIGGYQIQKHRTIKTALILLIGIFAVFMGGLAESYRFTYLFILVTLSFNINFFLKKT